MEELKELIGKDIEVICKVEAYGNYAEVICPSCKKVIDDSKGTLFGEILRCECGLIIETRQKIVSIKK